MSGPIPPDDQRAPKFWRDEVSGKLEGPIMRYLEGKPVSPEDVQLIRLYLQQWIDSPVWEMNPEMDAKAKAELAKLRESVRRIATCMNIDAWLGAAIVIGIDPL